MKSENSNHIDKIFVYCVEFVFYYCKGIGEAFIVCSLFKISHYTL